MTLVSGAAEAAQYRVTAVDQICSQSDGAGREALLPEASRELEHAHLTGTSHPRDANVVSSLVCTTYRLEF